MSYSITWLHFVYMSIVYVILCLYCNTLSSLLCSSQLLLCVTIGCSVAVALTRLTIALGLIAALTGLRIDLCNRTC